MELSARERAGSRKLLKLLDTADLLSLAGTVTKMKSTASTRAEAIDTILQNSQSAYQLLNRRKVLCGIIAAYLKNEGVPIPSKITKAEAVLKTLVYWSEQDSCIKLAGTSLWKNLYNTAVTGLSARERAGSRKLLKLLDTIDLLSLAGTVTKMKSTASTRAEAIDTILQNSQSAYELLNRRKVLCDIIAAYLKNEGVPIPSTITKAEAVLKTLVYWSELDSCIPVAAPFISSSIKPEQQKATATDFSHPFYFHKSKSSIHSPLEDASKTWKHGAGTEDLYEIITSVKFIQDRNPITSPLKQEMVFDISVQQRQKVSNDVTSSQLTIDISKMSTPSCQKKDRKQQPRDPQRLETAAEARGQRYLSSKLCSQQKPSWWSGPDREEKERECLQSEETSPYDTNYRDPSPKNFACRHRVVDEGDTVSKGKRGKLQKSKSWPVSGTMPHMATRSLLLTERQPANFEAKTEKVSAIPYTGITQVSQPPRVQQSAYNKGNIRVMTSLFTATEE